MTDIKGLLAMAKAGSASAQYELGELYYAGEFGVADLEEHFSSAEMTGFERANKATSEQERSLLFSGILLTQNRQSAVILPIRRSKEEAQKLLNDFWGITNESGAVNTLGYLSIADGHTHEINKAYQHILSGGKKSENFVTAEEMLLGFGYSGAELMTLPGLAAWDYGRTGFIARYSRQSGYIDDTTAWDYIGRSAKNAAESYDNWRQYLAAYVLGRALWGSDCTDMRYELGFLLCSRLSPYKRGISLKPGMIEPSFDFVLPDGDRGVKQDYAEAKRWYLPAAEQGMADAQYRLGNIYEFGKGVPEDNAEALKWYQKAAEQDHTKAQFKVGYMYYSGECVPQDYSKALEWYLMAAKKNDSDAQYNIGYIYEYKKDNFDEAARWYCLAAENGDADGQVALDRLASKEKPKSKLKTIMHVVLILLAVGFFILGVISKS